MSAATAGPTPLASTPLRRRRTKFPEVWSREQDLPGLPWCIAKGIAKAIVLTFFVVLLPIELLDTLFGASTFPITHPFTVALLTYGGGALALTSGAFTATQTTRLYGFFRLANCVVKLVYQAIIASLALITLGPLSLGMGGSGSTRVQFSAYFGFADVIYLFMIGTTLAALASLVTLYEDYKHPGERLPWDFPISKKKRRQREAAVAASLGAPPPA